jgi:hypothetical protein
MLKACQRDWDDTVTVADEDDSGENSADGDCNRLDWIFDRSRRTSSSDCNAPYAVKRLAGQSDAACRRSRKRTLFDYLASVVGHIPWRCSRCAHALPLTGHAFYQLGLRSLFHRRQKVHDIGVSSLSWELVYRSSCLKRRTLTGQLSVVLAYELVAFAGGLFERLAVQDAHRSSTVLNDF